MSGRRVTGYYSDNRDRDVISDVFIGTVISRVEHKVMRKLTLNQKDFIRGYIKSIPFEILQATPRGELMQKLVTNLSTEIDKDFYKGTGEINMREIQKSEIGVTSESNTARSQATLGVTSDRISAGGSVDISSILGNAGPYSIQKILNPQALFRRAYILLDTRFRQLDTDGTNTWSWNFVSSTARRQGSVNVSAPVRDLRAIRIRNSIKLPAPQKYVEQELDRISILIEELASQSVVAHENRRYHFMLQATRLGNYYILTPENEQDSIYEFSKPVTKLENLTLSFASPTNPILMYTDRLSVTFTAYAATTTLTTAVAHNLLTGDRIYLEDFTTNNTAADSAQIAQMNSTDGHIITVTSTTAFTIAVNTAAITPTPGLEITSYFGSKRAIIELEIQYTTPEESSN